MTRRFGLWFPAVLLLTGSVLTVGVDTQREMPLRESLETSVPRTIEGYRGTDQEISDEEIRVVGASDYLFRVFTADPAEEALPFTLYVGYYEQQAQGKTIHSPKNCLPGAGWEALTSSTHQVTVAGVPYVVNRYLIQRGDQQAMVLYWYQGRGRIAANEYKVKWDLLKDSALYGRSDEALVRLVVPVVDGHEATLRLATRAAEQVIPALFSALPA